MENPEEILHSLEEFSKTKPKDIPRELEEYLCFVAKTGDPVYQWPAIKSLFREKMINVITEFYETCPSVEIPACRNVDLFNYDVMKNFILEKLDTFAAAPFTLQRICELLTTPRKEYNRIDKYMRALEKNILVVSTMEPGGRRTTENGDSIMNGLESEHLPETSNSSDINVEEMDDAPAWPRLLQNHNFYNEVQETDVSESKTDGACTSTQDTVITCREEAFVSIEPVPSNSCSKEEETDVSVTITAIPAGVQKRRNSVEPVVSSESTESCDNSEEKAPADPPKEATSEAPTSQQEDADSSSSTEEENKDEAASEAPTQENETTSSEDVVGTSEEPVTAPDEAESKPEIDEEDQLTVDTTKCSEEESKDDAEISSTDKGEEEELVDSSERGEEEVKEEEKVDESGDVTPMEVEFSNSEKVEEVVAQATSDSTL